MKSSPPALQRLTSRRNILFCYACVVSLAPIASSFSGKPAGGALAFCAAIQWMLVLKFESDLRLLRVIDRLQK